MLSISARHSGAQFPVTKTPGPFLVIDAIGQNWTQLGTMPDNMPVSVTLHYDGDDPTFAFEDPENWPELPAKVVEDYNRPYRRTHRLAMARATDTSIHSALMPPHWAAASRMKVVAAERSNPDVSIIVDGHGGIVRGEDDSIASGCSLTQGAYRAAIDMWRARKDKRYRHADVNRRAIEHCGFTVMARKDGAIEFFASG